eukprot:TRINITY_DN11984_c0_g1_i1.p1 TRINITY_DN11984_c0_g1~~TRINITY_DN11984_c0_g1_i1.p1  ORF type:complete len:335 (-),score=59.51 TRINITY_DN11984_c0_g1_i1:407-1411(-)
MAWLELRTNPLAVILLSLTLVVMILGLFAGFIKRRLFLVESLLAAVCGIILGPDVLNFFDLFGTLNGCTELDHAQGRECHFNFYLLMQISRIVVVFQVFNTGETTRREQRRRLWRTIVTMLAIVMPLMLLTSWALCNILPVNYLDALLIAACVTPTDPVLSAAVVQGKFAEEHVESDVRDVISIESGANDGAAYPFVFIPLTIMISDSAGEFAGRYFAVVLCYQMLAATVAGVLIGLVAYKLTAWSTKHGLFDKHSYLGMTSMLILFTIGFGELFYMNDVWMGFVVGLVFGWWQTDEQADRADEVASTIDRSLMLAWFVLFGSALPWHGTTEPE